MEKKGFVTHTTKQQIPDHNKRITNVKKVTGDTFLHVMSTRAKLVGVYYEDDDSSSDYEGSAEGAGENGGTPSAGSAKASKKSRSRRNSCLARRQVQYLYILYVMPGLFFGHFFGT